MIRNLISLIIIFMGLFFIYDNDYFGSKQLVRDVKKEVALPQTNLYAKTNSPATFATVTNDFDPNNKQELLNIYYTIINSGWKDFVFYCDYSECINDVNNISTDAILLSNINSYVSTFNQYNSISTYTTPILNDKVRVRVIKTYDDYMVEKINERIDQLYKLLELDNLTDREKILKVHDYIVNNTKYDTLKIDNIADNTYHSSTAYGLLFEGYAICSGYADAMALFLDKMGIRNSKVASDTHVWNLVYLDGRWYHLDLTWDDPYAEGKNILSHNFFLIDYQQLKQWQTKEHVFDEKVYKEAL